MIDGTGVKIGALSDSIDHLGDAQAAGDLPPVTVLPGQGGLGAGEGTAMLEIIHSLAPGASLYFATAHGGIASFAQNIRDLQAAGCRVIVDDVLYFSESPFQDGPIAQAVSDVSAAGVLYFSAAGNSGGIDRGTSGTWEGGLMMAAPRAADGAVASTVLEEGQTTIRSCPEATPFELICIGLTHWGTRPTISMCMCWTPRGRSSAVLPTPRTGRATTLTKRFRT